MDRPEVVALRKSRMDRMGPAPAAAEISLEDLAARVSLIEEHLGLHKEAEATESPEAPPLEE